MLSAYVSYPCFSRLRSCLSASTPKPETIVNPAFVTGVVGRVDVDALHLAVISGEPRLERLQVVALDDEVVVQTRRLARLA